MPFVICGVGGFCFAPETSPVSLGFRFVCGKTLFPSALTSISHFAPRSLQVVFHDDLGEGNVSR
jgi:hypothetical protein